MKKKTPLPAKITVSIATTGIILLTLGMIKENFTISLVGLTLTLVGFFMSFVVSMIMDIKKMYPSRSDPFQKKMRALSYVSLTAGCTSFLSVGLVMIGLYNATGFNLLVNLGLTLIAGGIVVFIAVSVVMAVVSKASPPRADANVAVPPSGIAASKMPYSPDPVISRILANPYVLLDERIRQLHEVQNLLQYPEIQQVFFEPQKLYTLFDQPRVQELLNVVKRWITDNNAEDIFSAAAAGSPANTPRIGTVQSDKSAQPSSPKKLTKISTIVLITVIVWIAFFIYAVFIVLHAQSMK